MSKSDGRHLDGKEAKQRGIDHCSGSVGFPVGRSSAADRRRVVAYIGMRQRAGRLLRGASLWLLKGARSLHRRCRPRLYVQGLAGLANAQPELLADDPDRRRVGDLSRRHGRLPGRRQVLTASPSANSRHAIATVARIPWMSRWRRGTPIYGRPARHYPDFPGRHDHGQVHEGQNRPVSGPGPPRHGGAAGIIEDAVNLLEKADGPLVLVEGQACWSSGRGRGASFIESTQIRS